MIDMPGAEIAPRLGVAPPRSLRRRSDERLVRIARDGDERAFELLFERHGQALLRYCRSLLRAAEEAEDVRQEVFVLAISALRRGAEPRSFRPWLYRIAHNECVSHLRTRRPVLVSDNGVLAGPAVEPPDVHREELRQLLDDIRRLPEIQRGALLLREMDGFSYEQVGEVLGVPQSTVRASIFRARRTLQGLAEARDADCRAIQSELCELADRRGRRNRRITAHLRVCPSCRSFRDALRRRPAILGVTAPPAPAFIPVAPIGALLAVKAKLLGGASAGASAVAAAGGGAGAGAGATKVAALASTCAVLAAGSLEAERALDAVRRDRAADVRAAGTTPHRARPDHDRRAAGGVAVAPVTRAVRLPAATIAAGSASTAPPGTHRRREPDAGERRAREAPRPSSAPPAAAPAPQVAATPAEAPQDGGATRHPRADEADERRRPAPGGDTGNEHHERGAGGAGEPHHEGEHDERGTTEVSHDEDRSETTTSSSPMPEQPAPPAQRADEDEGDRPPAGTESPDPTATAAGAGATSPGDGPAAAARMPAEQGEEDELAAGMAGSTRPAPDGAGAELP